MPGNDVPSDPTDAEKSLLLKQSLRYAQDLVRVYEEEKEKRKELELANDRLRLEVEDRKRAEERFRAIFETAQDCIYIKDRSLRYTHVNPAMERLFGIPASEIIGKKDRDLYGKSPSRHLEEIDLRVLRGESIEEENTRPVGGMPTTFLEAKTPLHNTNGEIVGICGIARNITDWRMRQAPSPVTSEYPSKAMREALSQARLVAVQSTTVLLLGESGCGKDYMARFIHESSERNNGPFFSINCASVAPELAESELFGHEAGAFTGARARKRGLLELAEGGTLFLNEIGELSIPLQAKLLSFLDSRSFTRVGGEKNVSVNARLIAATNRDLEKAVEKDRFRRDLFYRLNVMSIRIPPLRERTEDFPVIVRDIVSELRNEIRLASPPEFGDDVIEALKACDWPGNVRELRNVLERALILTGGGKMTVEALGLGQSQKEWAFSTGFPENDSLNEVTKQLKRSLVAEALRRSAGNRVKAARLLGISRNSLNHYVATLNIKT